MLHYSRVVLFLGSLSLYFCSDGGSHFEKEVFISADQGLFHKINELGVETDLKHSDNGEVLFSVDQEDVETLSHASHEHFGKCGGFFLSEESPEVLEDSYFAPQVRVNYSLTEQSTVANLLDQIDRKNVLGTIEWLSSFNNRHYKSKTGIQSQEELADLWRGFAPWRSDIDVALIEHKNYDQRSAMLTIKGSHTPDEYVVIGGHGDSIAGIFGGKNAKAPGADDNASGIASLTEVARVMLSSGYKPGRSVVFISYAAEEAGLLGSADIAAEFAAEGKKVVGVMQLDMTNYNNLEDQPITLISDFVDKDLNLFLEDIIKSYTDFPYDFSRCGYACSDHASWTRKGYPAVIPFEVNASKKNRKIHTRNDTLTNSDSGAAHATKFSKIAMAFAVELAK